MISFSDKTGPQLSKNRAPSFYFKRLLLFFIFVPFIFIYIQQITPYVSVKPLKGDFVPAVSSDFNSAQWFSGNFQNETESFLNEQFGFRNFFVRLINQIKFVLFKTTTAKEVIVGKNNYLYVSGYINGYFGSDFITEARINDTITVLKRLQDTLRSMGKTLLVVLAPSKARVYPEYIPDRFLKDTVPGTNYDAFVNGFKKNGINYIDFSSLFLKRRSESPYLLIPQLGIHWSKLEAIKAADTIFRHLSFLAHTSQPKIILKGITVQNELIAPDNDAIEGMNTLFYPEYQQMAYPNFDYSDLDKPQYNALVIGDSYWWDIYLQHIPQTIFKSNEFWYYCRDVWGSVQLGKVGIEAIDVKRRLLQKDFIVILCSESNLERFGFGFPGAALNALRRPISPSEQELNDLKKKILSDSVWLTQIKEKALKKGVSIDSMVITDARWDFQNHGPVLQNITLQEVKKFILTDKAWMNDIRSKAASRNITIDSMVTCDAIWYLGAHIKANTKINPSSNLNALKNMIKADPVWMQQIKIKAAAKNISIDSMIVLDALWIIQEEKTKAKLN